MQRGDLFRSAGRTHSDSNVTLDKGDKQVFAYLASFHRATCVGRCTFSDRVFRVVGMIREFIITLVSLLLAVATTAPVAAQHPRMVRFQVRSEPLEGLRLIDVPQRTVILGRDGWLHDTIDNVQPSILGTLPIPFRAVTAAEMRGQLLAEFGRDFEVVPTTHYLIVQPKGRGDRWPKLFEGLYREFVSYMEVRGVPVRTGRFPLVAVVLPDQVAMRTEFQRLGIEVSRVAGVYHLASNRVIMHDQGNAGYVAETVRHETAHQTAYNVGVHSRVSETPRWVVEGIGSLFEPAVMQDRRLHRSMRDRVHAGYVKQFLREYADPQRLEHDLRRLVTDDDMFRDEQAIANAYCLSWAMVFYLSERAPEQFATVVQQTGKWLPFRVYPREQRSQDFERWVGVEAPMFATQLNRFVRGL